MSLPAKAENKEKTKRNYHLQIFKDQVKGEERYSLHLISEKSEYSYANKNIEKITQIAILVEHVGKPVM